MWEDEGAWNAYDTGQYDWGSGGGQDYSSYDWMNDQSANSGWQDSSANDWNGGGYQQTPSYEPPPGGGNPSWQQNYNYTPQYQSGAQINPYAAQITSGNPSPEEMYQRMGGQDGPGAAMQGFHYYRNQPGYQNDPALVEGEHYATSQYNLSSPLNATGIPQALTLAGVPAYDLAKYLAQSSPEWLRQYLPQFLTNASAPTFSSTWAGLKPLWNMPFGRTR